MKKLLLILVVVFSLVFAQNARAQLKFDFVSLFGNIGKNGNKVGETSGQRINQVGVIQHTNLVKSNMGAVRSSVGEVSDKYDSARDKADNVKDQKTDAERAAAKRTQLLKQIKSLEDQKKQISASYDEEAAAISTYHAGIQKVEAENAAILEKIEQNDRLEKEQKAKTEEEKSSKNLFSENKGEAVSLTESKSNNNISNTVSTVPQKMVSDMPMTSSAVNFAKENEPSEALVTDVSAKNKTLAEQKTASPLNVSKKESYRKSPGSIKAAPSQNIEIKQAPTLEQTPIIEKEKINDGPTFQKNSFKLSEKFVFAQAHDEELTEQLMAIEEAKENDLEELDNQIKELKRQEAEAALEANLDKLGGFFDKPDETQAQTIEQNFIPMDEPLNTKNVGNLTLKKERAKWQENIDSIAKAISLRIKLIDRKGEAEELLKQSNIQETTSDAVNVQMEVVINNIETLLDYAESLLLDMKALSAREISSPANRVLNAEASPGELNLCKYEFDIKEAKKKKKKGRDLPLDDLGGIR